MTARAAYDRWAPHYRGDNAICIVEDRLAAAMMPPVAGKRILDAGCGVGLRIRDINAALAVGVDISPQMVTASGLKTVLVADVRALPFPAGSFDQVWCRLMIGHLPNLGPVYAELARVCRSGGQVLVTDFHADASQAGHRQTFRDCDGALHEIAHHTYSGSDHILAAAEQELSLVEKRAGAVDAGIRSLYKQAGRLAMYERDKGLNIVAAFLFQKTEPLA